MMTRHQALFRIYDAIEKSKKRIVALAMAHKIHELEKEIDLLCLLQSEYSKQIILHADQMIKTYGWDSWTVRQNGR